MYHELFHQFKQMWIGNFIWKFCGHNLINCFCHGDVRGTFQENNEMNVWQSSFLIFNSVYKSLHFAKHTFLHDIVNQAFDFEMENACDNVRLLCRSLVQKQSFFDFSPLGIMLRSHQDTYLMVMTTRVSGN